MDGVTRLAIGGTATVAASIAVVCVVAMSSAAALADVAGAPIGTRPVIIPSAATVPTPTASTSAVPPAATAQTPADQPEAVPAPDPEDIAPAPAPVEAPSAETESQFIAEVAASGSWDSARAWAADRGWSPAQVDMWIAQLQSQLDSQRAAAESSSTSGPEQLVPADPQIPATADETSGQDLPGLLSGLKREQSRVPPG